jgi:plastocyanin
MTGSAMAATHTVNVGGLPSSPALTFVPSSVNIAVGDTVMFAFNGMHTASQGSSGDPCSPASPSEFDFSGNAGQTFNHTFSTAGSFNMYCQIPGHCAAGMHGVILVGQASASSASSASSSSGSTSTAMSAPLYGTSGASSLIPGAKAIVLGCLLTGAAMIGMA